MLRCYELAHIVGISKTTYVLATPRCLDWRRDLQRTSTNNDPSDSDSRILVAGLLVVIAAIAAALGYQLLASSSSRRPRHTAPRVSTCHVLRSEHRGALGEADGAVPDGATVFDDEIPGVANLDPDLLGALRQAATDAADDGVEFFVDSGWRSPEYQNQLLREAVSEYGSEEEAARWVATAETSAHVSGTRSTLGPSMPRRGCPNTAPSTGYARSTATNPGTTNCAPKPSITVARPCTPTLRTIQGCSSDQHARHRTGVNAIATRERNMRETTAAGRPCHDRPDQRGCSSTA